MGLYTFLYGNPLYRLYTTGIQPPLLVPARLSRYTAHTAHTAIQPYTPYIIQRHTASLSSNIHILVGVPLDLQRAEDGRAVRVGLAYRSLHNILTLSSGYPA